MRTITSKEKDVERKDGSPPRVFRYISPPNALAVTFTKASGSFISEDREDIRRLRRKGTKLRVHLTGSGGNRDTWTRNRQHEAGNFGKWGRNVVRFSTFPLGDKQQHHVSPDREGRLESIFSFSD